MKMEKVVQPFKVFIKNFFIYFLFTELFGFISTFIIFLLKGKSINWSFYATISPWKTFVIWGLGITLVLQIGVYFFHPKGKETARLKDVLKVLVFCLVIVAILTLAKGFFKNFP